LISSSLQCAGALLRIAAITASVAISNSTERVVVPANHTVRSVHTAKPCFADRVYIA
jgi:hypothetical protein